MIGLNLLSMGLFFLLCFCAEEAEYDPKFPDNFTTLEGYAVIFGSIITLTILMNVLCFTLNKFKSVNIFYFVSIFLSVASFISFIIILGVSAESKQGVTLDASRVLVGLIGCIILNTPTAINLLWNTCRKCFHYRSVAKTGSDVEKVTEYVKGWTETKTVGTAKDIYGNIVYTVEKEIHHPGHNRTKTEHFNKYTCFVCGNKTRD